MTYAEISHIREVGDISTDVDDGVIRLMLESATAAIDNHTGRTFAASTDSARTFDAERDVDGQVLYLDADLCAITSIVNGDGTTLSASDYTTEPRNRTPYYAIRLLRSSSAAWEYNSTTSDPEDAITITGKWGYSTAPDNTIRKACIRLATYLYRQRENASDLDRPVIAGTVTLLPGQMPRDIEVDLEPYVVRVD